MNGINRFTEAFPNSPDYPPLQIAKRLDSFWKIYLPPPFREKLTSPLTASTLEFFLDLNVTWRIFSEP